MGVCENLARSKLGGDMKFCLVLREAPTQLRDKLLVNSQQINKNCTQLRSALQTFLYVNKPLVLIDFRETMEPDPCKTEK